MKVLALALTISFSALPACSPSPQAGGGIGGTGSISIVSSGPVTKLHDLSVSGTEYDTSNSLYCMDGEPCSTENNLKLGMVVIVRGTAQSPSETPANRVADIITFEETVEGVVQSVAPDGSGLVVLGQSVTVDPKTVIEDGIPGGSIANLKPGVDAIEVSGFVAGDGHILATLVMRRSGMPQFEVEGVIKNHDTVAKRFEIGQLVVEYSSAVISDILVGDTMPWNGRLVHVRGDAWQPRNEVPHGATLRSISIKPLSLSVEGSSEAKIEGFITHMTQSGALTINNHPITLLSDTTFEGGTADELIPGAHVLIHGSLIQGLLEAHEVVFKENLQAESNVESIDLQSRTLTLTGLPGLVIETDARTLIEGGGVVIPFENIRIGDHLKIHAKLMEGQRASATEVERTGPSLTIVLEAPLQSAAEPQIQLAGVKIDTSDIPDDAFLGIYGPIGRATFFERPLVGRLVWGKGSLNGSSVIWRTVGVK